MSESAGWWTRYQRLELELLGTGAALAKVTEERDSARAFAVRLESELAARDAGVVLVPLIGEAT